MELSTPNGADQAKFAFSVSQKFKEYSLGGVPILLEYRIAQNFIAWRNSYGITSRFDFLFLMETRVSVFRSKCKNSQKTHIHLHCNIEVSVVLHCKHALPTPLPCVRDNICLYVFLLLFHRKQCCDPSFYSWGVHRSSTTRQISVLILYSFHYKSCMKEQTVLYMLYVRAYPLL